MLRNLLALVLPLAVACGPEPPPARKAPPSVLLISLDTCRPDRLSFAGADRENSPRLDELAAEAAVFTDCLSQSSSTGPAHMSLFTGQYVHRHGMRSHRRAVVERTLASVLARAGYATAAFTGGGYLRSAFGLDHGFKKFVENDPRPALIRGFASVLPEALRWIDNNGHRPFFLLVHGYDVHCPYEPPEPYRSRYAGWYDGDASLDQRCGPSDFQPLFEEGRFGPDERRALNDLYDAGIAGADEALGAFLDELERRGVLERTLVVFTSDHGESLGEHDWVGHATTWEEQLRVPLVLRFPGGEHAGAYDAPVELVDVMPTVLDALGLEQPPGMHGRSTMPLLRGEERASRERMRVAARGTWEAVRFDDRYKLVLFLDGDALVPRMLFDLVADPGESVNLLTTEEGRARAEEIAVRYRAWRASTRAEDERFGGRDGGAPPLDSAARAELSHLGYTDE